LYAAIGWPDRGRQRLSRSGRRRDRRQCHQQQETPLLFILASVGSSRMKQATPLRAGLEELRNVCTWLAHLRSHGRRPQRPLSDHVPTPIASAGAFREPGAVRLRAGHAAFRPPASPSRAALGALWVAGLDANFPVRTASEQAEGTTGKNQKMLLITSVPTLIEQIQLVRRFLREVLKGSVLKQA
jgi:hypothetical protein